MTNLEGFPDAIGGIEHVERLDDGGLLTFHAATNALLRVGDLFAVDLFPGIFGDPELVAANGLSDLVDQLYPDPCAGRHDHAPGLCL